MNDFTFKLLLSIPLYILLAEVLIHIYYLYFDFSFVVQLSLLLLWSVEVWWVLKKGIMPLPVLLASAFVVFYLGLVVDSPLKLSVYVNNALWAILYTYVLGDCYRRLLNKNATAIQGDSFSNED